MTLFFRHKAMRTIKLMKIKTAMIALIVAVFSLHASAAQTALTPFDAQFTAYKWDDDIGTVSMKLETLSRGQYSLTYSSEVSKFFLSDERFEHSIFRLRDGKLVPSTYYYKRSGTGSDKHLELTFRGAPANKIEVKGGKALTWSGETDNQLYRLDVARKLAAGETSMEYSFINYRGEKKHYAIEVVARETVTLPYGKLDAIKVRIVRHNTTRETFAWFAPALNYNLVRLQQFKDGEEQGDIRLKSYTSL